MARMIKNFKVPEKSAIPGFREMQQKDVPQVRALLNKYLDRFDFAPQFETDKDVEHWVLPHKGVVWSYVVEVSELSKGEGGTVANPDEIIGSFYKQDHRYGILLLFTQLGHR